MGKKSPEVNAYIEKSAPFAKPILKKLRAIFHKASPKLEENIKWGMPSFECNGIVGGIAAFKKHVSWGLWKAALIKDPKKIMSTTASSAMGGGKLVTVDDLPDENDLIDLIRQGVALNASGTKLPTKTARAAKPPISVPSELAMAFRSAPESKAFFDTLSPSSRREYLEWITETSRDETKAKRIATTIEWLGQGRKRNWKYEKC